MNDKPNTPIPPAVAEFALEQLAASTAKPKAIDRIVAANRLRQYIGKASFSHNADRQAALEGVDLLAADNCEVLRARLSKYEDAEGRPLQSSMPDALAKVGAFLLGEGEIEGYSFGQAPPNQGNFWWRKELRTALESQAREIERLTRKAANCDLALAAQTQTLAVLKAQPSAEISLSYVPHGDGSSGCASPCNGSVMPDANYHVKITAQQPSGLVLPADWEESLNHALVIETERAIRQRDEYLRTGVVTAGHGGSHDTAIAAENKRLKSLINTPHTDEWFEAVRLEAAHQIERWGTEHDAGKTPADWFWLLGFLGGKALNAAITGNEDKAKHHTISSGAALLNWFRSMVGDSNLMRPGSRNNSSSTDKEMP